MRRIIATVAATAALIGTAYGIAVVHLPRVVTVHDTRVVTKVVHTLPECAEEDSANCIWHADKSGNGEGVSFVDVDGTAYYAEAPVDPPLVGDVIDGQRVTSVEADGSFTTEPATWQGFSTGEVIVCAPGLEVAPDVTADGTAWASCQ